MNAQQFISDALGILGVLAPGEVPSAVESADAFGRLNRMISTWAAQALTIHTTQRYVHALIANQRDYTIGPGADFNQPRPTWLPYAGLILDNLTPSVEVPLQILTLKDWTLLGIKDLPSTQPTSVYYDFSLANIGATAGFGTIAFWPVPQIAYQVALYTPTPLAQFADLLTEYAFAPAYEEAIAYNLAVRLARPFGQTPPTDVQQLAKDTLAVLKTSNARMTDLSIDPALRPFPQTLYNWRSDTIR